MIKNVVIVVLIAFSGLSIYLSNQIASLNSIISALEASKAALSKANAKLTSKNQKLTKQNKRLVSQRTKAKKMVAEHRKKTIRRNMSRASKKMAKASGSMIPFAGITVIAVATADDIRDYCSDIKSIQELEHTLFDGNSSTSHKEAEYCHESVGKEIAVMAESARKSVVRDFGISYRALKKQSNEMIVSMKRVGEGVLHASYKDEFKQQYGKVVDYWSRKIEAIKSEPVKQSYEAPSTLERTRDYWFGKIYSSKN